MASKVASAADLVRLQARISELELTVQALNTNYTTRNWSSNFNLLQQKDLGFSLVVGQSLQPFTTVSGIVFTKNSTTTVLTTTGGPSGGGAIQGIWLAETITDVATVGPSGNLILTIDNIVTTIPLFPSQANQLFSTTLTNMMVKNPSTSTGLLAIPAGQFQNSAIVQIEFDNNGNTVAGNTILCEVMWSKNTT